MAHAGSQTSDLHVPPAWAGGREPSHGTDGQAIVLSTGRQVDGAGDR